MKTILYTALAFFISSCTTIEIKEADIFDNHKTVTPQTFDNSQIRLVERMIPTSDGETINAWFFYRDDAIATVLYTGGNGFLMVKSGLLVNMFEQIPVNFVLFDYRGFGQSSGTPTIAGLKNDVEAIIGEIHLDEDLSHVPIINHGHSMGSFLASDAARKFYTDALILESPISNPESWSRGMVPWFLRPFIRLSFEDHIAKEDNMVILKEWEKPLLIMNGTEDNITPMFMSEELYEVALSNKKHLIKINGGNHNDLPGFEEYVDAYRELIEMVLE